MTYSKSELYNKSLTYFFPLRKYNKNYITHFIKTYILCEQLIYLLKFYFFRKKANYYETERAKLTDYVSYSNIK